MIWKGGPVFLLLIALCAALCLYEWMQLAFRSQHALIFAVVGVVYISFSFWVCYTLREEHSVKIALLFITMIWASDTGAYLAGKSIGGMKMTPNISPNKTWSGLMGAMIAPGIAGALYVIAYDWVYNVAHGRDFFELVLVFVLFGCVIGLVGQAGDLLISMFKRHVSVKDAGYLIPGHGGLLDRVDAMMLAAPVYLCFVSRFFNEITN